MTVATKALAAMAVIGLIGVTSTPAVAQKAGGACVEKGGKGWASDLPGARFQAWEAVLQATSWGMWSSWITGGAKIGQAAAGYSVSNVREKCSKDGSQHVCIMRAKLCN